MKMIENIKNIFKKKDEVVHVKGKKLRSFYGAMKTRYTKWIDGTLQKINQDINFDLVDTIGRCRELAKNEPIVRSYLGMCRKNIIGKSGFVLQCQLKKSDSELDEELNDDIEWAWYDWGKRANNFLTVNGGLGHTEFDSLILQTLLVDGEAFIRIHKDAKNPYGLSFELIDSLALDWSKKRDFNFEGRAWILGVEVDENYKPTSYFIKKRKHHSIPSWCC